MAACIVPTTHAQVDRAGLTGTVTDTSGKALSGVRITALQTATGLHRETLTSSTGTYDIPELPVGVYRVTYSEPGFQQKVIEGLDQTVGHTRTVNVVLAVGGVVQHVKVSDLDPQLDQTSATLGAPIEPKQVKELPLNGRNWSTLTALVPGAVDTGGSNQRSLRFAGRGIDDNNFTYDGIDATNVVNQAFSHEIDQDAAGSGESEFPENPACPACERASGDFDVRHVLNANAVYDLHFGPVRALLSNPGIASAVLGCWSVMTIATARTGPPVNVTEDRSSSSVATGYTTSQRPNLIPGRLADTVGRPQDRPVDQSGSLCSGNEFRARQRLAQHRARAESLAG
jgi:Carboxypeptidase regulatory-like domain